MVLLDVGNKSLEEASEALNPGDLIVVPLVQTNEKLVSRPSHKTGKGKKKERKRSDILSLVLAEELVGVELGATLELSSVGAGGGLDSDPCENGDSLRDGREVVPLGITAGLLTGLDGLGERLRGGSKELSEVLSGRLGRLGGVHKESTLGLDGSLEELGLQ